MLHVTVAEGIRDTYVRTRDLLFSFFVYVSRREQTRVHNSPDT